MKPSFSPGACSARPLGPGRLLISTSLTLLALNVDAAPAPGRYDGELCVALSAAAPHCGKAELRRDRSGAVSVRVDDIVYHLKFHGGQVETVLMHGATEIDEFVAPYVWAGDTLQFADTEKEARYEVRFTPPRRR